jgi:SpoIIAA-like
MPIAMQHERDNIYRLEVSGVLKKSDLDQSQAMLAAEMGRIGSTRLLFILKGFEGWEANPNWGDLTFYVKHGDSIERIAIVGDERWRGEALMFAAADLRRAPVEFFSENAIADARAWLAG